MNEPMEEISNLEYIQQTAVYPNCEIGEQSTGGITFFHALVGGLSEGVFLPTSYGGFERIR